MEPQRIIYFPTPEEKVKIDAILQRIVNELKPLPIEQQAFAMQVLIKSFQEVSGVKKTTLIQGDDPYK